MQQFCKWRKDKSCRGGNGEKTRVAVAAMEKRQEVPWRQWRKDKRCRGGNGEKDKSCRGGNGERTRVAVAARGIGLL
jgi:hypothetical protein